MLENQFTYWSDNSSMTVVFMNKSQDKYYFGNQDCVVFTPQNRLGVWNKKHCTTTAPGFICKWEPNRKPSLPRPGQKSLGSYCANGFVQFNQTCYKLVTTPENYTDAQKKCQAMFPKKYRKYIGLARISQLEDNGECTCSRNVI